MGTRIPIGGGGGDELAWTGFWRVRDWIGECRDWRQRGRARPHVLIADGEGRDLDELSGFLEGQGFSVVAAQTRRAALAFLSQDRFAAVVTEADLPTGPGEGGREPERDAGLDVLRAARSQSPPGAALVLASKPRRSTWLASIEAGAEAYLPKPLDPGLVAGELQRALHGRAVRSESVPLEEMTDILADLVADAIERIDPYTAGHSRRTRVYCDTMAARLGLPEGQRRRLELAAVAHDYGKIFLEDLGFLTKPGPLTDTEFRSVKQHPLLGAEKLGRHGRLQDVCRWIREHHERWDGRGYPHGLAGDEISMPGRMLCIAEVFDSLVTRRSYKEPWSLAKTTSFLADQRGRAFDPEVCDVFLELVYQHGEQWLSGQADRARAPGA